jgi:hypothetical protein
MKKTSRTDNQERRSSPRKLRSTRHGSCPLTPAKAGVQSQELDARLRGHERSLASGATTQRHWGCMAGTVIYRGDVDLTEPTEAWDADQDEAPRSAKATEP